jgi:hypothetical protein
MARSGRQTLAGGAPNRRGGELVDDGNDAGAINGSGTVANRGVVVACKW